MAGNTLLKQGVNEIRAGLDGCEVYPTPASAKITLDESFGEAFLSEVGVKSGGMAMLKACLEWN